MEQFEPQKIEEKILSYWKEEKIYEKAKAKNQKGVRFKFIDGPPYTTGSIHLGTAWNKVLKDFYLRYKRMRGFNVRAQPGYDMHGLPIEVKVEETLRIKNKKEISEKLGEERFIMECKNFSLKNLETMSSQFQRLGVWMDWNAPYKTIENSYIEGVWWALKEAHKKNLLYQGPRVITWCARCATALAKHELEYENITETSVFVKFSLEGRENEFILIWTTTPWTLPANMFVAVNPDFKYVKAKLSNGEVWILAKELAGAVLGSMDKKFEIIETLSGKDLKGMKYVHPFEDEILSIKKFKDENKFVCTVIPVEGNFVTLEAGCGCVHGSPGTGAEDFDVALPYNLLVFCPVDENGTLTEDAGFLKGLRTKKDDFKIVSLLKEKGLLVHEAKVTHEYPHCWRCKSAVIFRATLQWYLAVSKLKENMISENKKIKWTPEWGGSSWFRDWLENIQDWCISRQRFWGIPLPIWKCKNEHVKVIGLRSELTKELKDMHRPWIDKITFECKECKEKMSRVPDILDVWLESGAATWATLPYPENKEEFSKWWPADFITEGKDQIRGWFNSQMCLSMLAFGKTPYKSVYMHGFVSDNKGLKMSKSLGNIVNPEEVISKVGADAFRFYSIATNAGEDLRFSWNDLTEAYKVLNTLWNAAQFLEYMKLGNFNTENYTLNKNKLKPEDAWILSEVNLLNERITHAFESHNFEEVPRLLQNFIVEDLSRWYIKLIRERTWVSAEGEDKLVAFKVLYECLKKTLLLSAPVIPMITEEIYLKLVKPLSKALPESIHMLEWPSPEKSFIKPELETAMNLAKEIAEAARFAREDIKIKLRWPLKALAVETSKENEKLLAVFKNVIKEQANVKMLKFGKIKGTEKPFSGGKIYLDTEITQDILAEALLREVMRSVQVLRKENNFKVEEKISLSLSIADETLLSGVQKFKKELAEKVGAKEIKIGAEKAEGKFKGELEFEGKKVFIVFDKAK